MNAVPTTPTFTDSLKEHKDLKDEISGLKNAKATLKGECETYAKTKTALLEELRIYGYIPELKDRVKENIKNALQASIDAKKNEESSLVTRLSGIRNDHTIGTNKLLQLKVEVQALDGNLTKLKGEVTGLSITKNNLQKEYDKKQSAEQAALQIILDKQKSAENRLTELDKDYETKMQNISEGERRLAEKGQDLAIYEARLRKACLELYPEMEIILTNYD